MLNLMPTFDPTSTKINLQKWVSMRSRQSTYKPSSSVCLSAVAACLFGKSGKKKAELFPADSDKSENKDVKDEVKASYLSSRLLLNNEYGTKHSANRVLVWVPSLILAICHALLPAFYRLAKGASPFGSNLQQVACVLINIVVSGPALVFFFAGLMRGNVTSHTSILFVISD